jgi:hypothetical protein
MVRMDHINEIEFDRFNSFRIPARYAFGFETVTFDLKSRLTLNFRTIFFAILYRGCGAVCDLQSTSKSHHFEVHYH